MKRLILQIGMILCVLLWSVPAWATEASSDCDTGNHNYEVTIIQKATDTEDGIREYRCLDCGYTYTEAIPATGHLWSEWIVDVPAGCTTPGHQYRVCTRFPDAPHMEEEIIPAIGSHDYRMTETEPDCTHSGIRTFTCSRCGDTYTQEYAPALGHQYVEEITQNPTTDTQGIRTFTCIRGDDTYQVPISMLPEIKETEAVETKAVIQETIIPETTEAVFSENASVMGNTQKEHVWNTMDIIFPAAGVGIAWWYVILLYPYLMVLLWARKKRKEAMEKKRKQEEEMQLLKEEQK